MRPPLTPLFAVLRELAGSLPVGSTVTLDAREVARAHPGAIAALETEFEGLPLGFIVEQ